MKIQLKNDIERSKNSNTLSTTFYVEHDGYVFPDRLWTDFTYPVLQDWGDTLLKHMNQPITSFELMFMDGPYALYCTKQNQKLEIECARFDTHDTEYTFSCETTEMLQAVCCALTNLINIIQNDKQYSDAQICEELSNLQARLSQCI